MVRSSTEAGVVCALGSWEAGFGGNATIRVIIDGHVRAKCLLDGPADAKGDGCMTIFHEESTPTLVSVTPSAISAGDAILITRLASAYDGSTPEVAVGGVPCTGVSHNTTHIVCASPATSGGIQDVTVRYATGFAREATLGYAFLLLLPPPSTLPSSPSNFRPPPSSLHLPPSSLHPPPQAPSREPQTLNLQALQAPYPSNLTPQTPHPQPHTLGRCCSTVRVAVQVSASTPASASAFGGQVRGLVFRAQGSVWFLLKEWFTVYALMF